MFAQLVDSDIVCTYSVDGFLNMTRRPEHITPEQMLYVRDHARDQLYSDIIQRFPRIAAYIMHVDLEADIRAAAVYKGLCNHALDPNFVALLMRYIESRNITEEKFVVGALLAKIENDYLGRHLPKEAPTETKTKKGEKPEHEPKKDLDMDPFMEIAHIHEAIKKLLGGLAAMVQAHCGNLNDHEALVIAACIALGSGDSIKEIIASDIPVTGDIFQVLENPNEIIKDALLLLKADFTKLTKNQEEFIKSLTRWIFKKLNSLETATCHVYLVSVYGSRKPELEKYLIQIKDCGTMYSNLLVVAKQMTSNDL